MQDLIIIGNGFDKAHNLKTDYKDFINYLLNEANENPNKFENLFTYKQKFGINDVDQIKHVGYSLSEIFKTDNRFFQSIILEFKSHNWCDFENFYFDILSERFKGYGNSVKVLNNEFQTLKDYLEEYLLKIQNNYLSLGVYEEFFNKIDLNREQPLILNFNYTNTVKKYIHQLKKVRFLPIHGELYNMENPIIFGYAADDQECADLLRKNDNEYLRNIKKHSYKRTNYYKELKKFMDDSKEIRVSIFGHSCGISDKLILNEIFSNDHVKEIFIYYFEKYDDYYEKQVNINRISLNDIGLNKLVNFEASHRMPQYNDKQDKHAEFTKFCNQIYG